MAGSGVAGRCFLMVAEDCDGLCRFQDGMACEDCTDIATTHEWEAAKQPYNEAVNLAAGDQLICTHTGCWQYIPKKKDQEYCTICSRERCPEQKGKGMAKRKRKQSNSPSQHKRMCSNLPCTPPPDPRCGSSRGSGVGQRLGVDAQAVSRRIGVARQLLTTCVDHMEGLQRTMNQLAEQFEVIEHAQCNMRDNIVEIADQD